MAAAFYILVVVPNYKEKFTYTRFFTSFINYRFFCIALAGSYYNLAVYFYREQCAEF
jgi:hypothetical protein